jgi:hypothetical protein
MSIRAPRGIPRLLVAVALTWVGLAICAQAALATHGRIQVAKVNVGGNPNDAFAFHPAFSQTNASDFSLKGGQTSQPFDVPCNIDRPGHGTECTSEYHNITLSVTEKPASGYALTSIVCRYTQSNDDNNKYPAGQPGPNSPVKPASEVTTDLAGGTVTLKVHYDEWVLCTYTNTANATPPPGGGTTPPPPGGSTPPPPSTGTQPTTQQSTTPQIEVSPARVRPGSAKVSGPTGCARSDVVAASVSGRRIVKVTFYVDNKKVKTLHKANRGSRWVLSMRIRRLAFGSHRVRAKVEFAKSSQTKARTLPLSFSRCRSAAARPQFTG